MKTIRLMIRMLVAMVFLGMAHGSYSQGIPDFPPSPVPQYLNVPAFGGSWPDANWTRYGYPFGGMWSSGVDYSYTNYPHIAHVGTCPKLWASFPLYDGISVTVSNRFDPEGNATTNVVDVFQLNGLQLRLLVCSTNDQVLADMLLGDATVTNNWQRFRALIPPITNLFVKLKLQIPYTTGVLVGGPGGTGVYIPDNQATIGGVRFTRYVAPPADPPFVIPASTNLVILRSNAVVQLSWPASWGLDNVQESSSVVDGTWTQLSCSIDTTQVNGVDYHFTRFPMTNDFRFYRVSN